MDIDTNGNKIFVGTNIHKKKFIFSATFQLHFLHLM